MNFIPLIDNKPTEEELRDRRLAWINALESGTLNQTTGRLCRIETGFPGIPDKLSEKLSESFCCLGVACAVYNARAIPTKSLWTEPTEPTGRGYVAWFDGQLHSPPPDVLVYYQMTVVEQDKLIHMNDYEGLSFSEIAVYLRGLWEL